MKIFFTIIIVISSFLGFSQTDTVDTKATASSKSTSNELADLLRKGDDYFFVGNFKKALPILKQAQMLDSNIAVLNFKIGVCYVKIRQVAKALPYFSKSKDLDRRVDPKIDYALGLAYQDNQKYMEAIASYKNYLSSLHKKKLILEKGIVDAKISACQKAIEEQGFTSDSIKETLTDQHIPITKQKSIPKTENKYRNTQKASEKENTQTRITPKDVVDTPINKGITYRIQIVSASNILTEEVLRSIYTGPLTISYQIIDGSYKYFIGDFKSKKEAKKARSLSGVEGAFIVRFKDGVK